MLDCRFYFALGGVLWAEQDARVNQQTDEMSEQDYFLWVVDVPAWVFWGLQVLQLICDILVSSWQTVFLDLFEEMGPGDVEIRVLIYQLLVRLQDIQNCLARLAAHIVPAPAPPGKAPINISQRDQGLTVGKPIPQNLTIPNNLPKVLEGHPRIIVPRLIGAG